MSTIFLTIEEILAMHEDQLRRYGGGSGIRDVGLLEAAVHRPQSGYYETEIEMAAALWESLSQNHPFIDGNKRTALAAVDTFLTINGYQWRVDYEVLLAFLMERYETASMKFEILRDWLRINMIKS